MALGPVRSQTVEVSIFPCPCCGWLVFGEPPGSDDICPVCGWDDDLSQLRFVGESGAQAPLIECQAAWTADSMPQGLERDPHWRPFDPARDPLEVPVAGFDYGLTYPADPIELYYWRL